MRNRIPLAICCFLLSACSATTSHARPPAPEDLRGWDYLIQQLETLGADHAVVRKLYQDPRMPAGEPVPFTLNPVEHAAMYSQVATTKNIDLARAFMQLHAVRLKMAEKSFGVSQSVITSILLIESHFGANTGHELVLNRLSRLATLGAPENIEFNYNRLHPNDPSVTREALIARAKSLRETFAPEILALVTMSKRNGIDPLELHGSSAGAFGMPQFLPSSYLHYAVDGNGDGRISLFDPDDAIYSIGNFLKLSGWKNNSPLSEKRKAIWKYNKSDEYINAVLNVAGILDKKIVSKKKR